MKVFLSVTFLFLLISANAFGGSEYDKCIKEENALKAQEANDCSGLSYLFNPSGCFATQKLLKKYTATEKCKKIGVAENVDFNTPAVIPVKKVNDVNPVAVKKSVHESTHNEIGCEQLKDENLRLKEENNRLKAENEQLRKVTR